MHRFYVEEQQIKGNEIFIYGTDVNHIKNVLRIKPEEQILICNGQGKDFCCIIKKISGEEIVAQVQSIQESEAELETKIYLFQGLPKKDKMELIIQKAVELGVYEIIPVIMKRTIVKLDEKKKECRKLERWRSIAASAAKQSGRGILPNISEVMEYSKALDFSKTLEYNILPYEKAEDVMEARKVVHGVLGRKSIGIFIGPEGGFEESEVKSALDLGVNTITLGKRILRTETAGIATLSIIMFEMQR